MVVLKFGGTSVQNAQCMDQAIDIVMREINNAPVMVSSAMSKITDSLLMTADLATKGDTEGALSLVDTIAARHREVAQAFLTGDNLAACLKLLDGYITELRSLTRGLLLLRECSPRTFDAIVAFGEIMSTCILAHRIRERGTPADLVDSRNFVKTDETFMSAAPNFARIAELTPQFVKPAKGKIVVAQGFIGSTENGVTSTLGRGGSDYTATIIGSALKAGEVQIWTDVDGIMTTDPRITKAAVSIPKISYQEAAELAFFGAKVVHPSTIQPAVDLGIPVWVKNTHNPDHPGTVILPAAEGKGVRAIAAKKKITLINVSSSRMLNAYGFLSRIFAIFEKYRTPVDLVATSEVSVSMSVESTKNLDDISRELSAFATVEVTGTCGILCLVGKDIWLQERFFARTFAALEGIPVRLISMGASDINLSMVVAESDCEQAVARLHKEFFEA